MAYSGTHAVPLLLTGMIATCGEENSEESAVGGSGSPFVIKNTFICEADTRLASLKLRRSRSAPALAAPDAEAVAERRCRPSPSPSSEHWSVASTSAHTDDEEDEESEESVEDEDEESKAEVLCQECVTLTLADLVPSDASPPLRSSLDTKAKAYQPSSDPPWPNLQIRQDIATVMVAVESALRSSLGVETVKSCESAASWCVVGVSKPQHPLKFQNVLAVVKQTMLTAAEKSPSVFLLGYEATPFLNLPGRLGFSATLAYVADEESACWDLLGKGCCARGQKCRWQHPAKLVQVTVGLDIQP